LYDTVCLQAREIFILIVISCNESGGKWDKDKGPGSKFGSRNVGLPGVDSASNRNKYSGVCYNEQYL